MLMPRPRKSETSTGATFATPSGTPTGISWRFNSARSDVPRVRDDFDAGRGEGDVYIYMYMYIWRERGFGFDSNVYRLAVNRASKENGQWAR